MVPQNIRTSFVNGPSVAELLLQNLQNHDSANPEENRIRSEDYPGSFTVFLMSQNSLCSGSLQMVLVRSLPGFLWASVLVGHAHNGDTCPGELKRAAERFRAAGRIIERCSEGERRSNFTEPEQK